VCLQLSKEMRPVTGVSCVVRLPSTSQMGIHLGRLVPAEKSALAGVFASDGYGERLERRAAYGSIVSPVW
jgi:hypothetical protein